VTADIPPPRVVDCVFCAIVAGIAPATIVRRWPDALAIVPLGPVVDGHLLVIPTVHVEDYTTDPEVTAVVARRAAEIASHPSNLITSAGREATQSVFHLHAHVVPRAEDDGLALPWYSGKRSPRRVVVEQRQGGTR
jgi:histidine triad (HIT) family protein